MREYSVNTHESIESLHEPFDVKGSCNAWLSYHFWLVIVIMHHFYSLHSQQKVFPLPLFKKGRYFLCPWLSLCQFSTKKSHRTQAEECLKLNRVRTFHRLCPLRFLFEIGTQIYKGIKKSHFSKPLPTTFQTFIILIFKHV